MNKETTKVIADMLDQIALTIENGLNITFNIIVSSLATIGLLFGMYGFLDYGLIVSTGTAIAAGNLICAIMTSDSTQRIIASSLLRDYDLTLEEIEEVES